MFLRAYYRPRSFFTPSMSNPGGEGQSNPALDRTDTTYYTTNWGKGPTLKDHEASANLSGRTPWERHKNRINVAFCDGHGEVVMRNVELERVRISPYK